MTPAGATPSPVAWRVSTTFADSRRRGTAPWPSRSSGTKAAPSRRRVGDAAPAAARRRRSGPCRRRRRQPLAGQRVEQLVLAVAGDAGDADDLAGPHVEARPSLRATAKGWGFGSDSPRTARRTGASSGGGSGGSTAWTSAPTIRLASAPGGLLLRVALGDHLAVAQDGGVMADRPHLLEPVADVEDRAAFRGEALQRDEQVVGLLRRQHRGRLVHDDELRLLQQAADDLDPLPLADREVGDHRVGVERQAVVASTPTRSGASGRRGRSSRSAPARCSRRRSARRTARNAGTPCRCRARRAAAGLAMVTGWPRQRISPEVGWSAP